jgi:hypothetical protein
MSKEIPMDEQKSAKDDERPLFQGIDELERTYAPQQLPPDDPANKRVRAEEGTDAAEGTGLDEGSEPDPMRKQDRPEAR